MVVLLRNFTSTIRTTANAKTLITAVKKDMPIIMTKSYYASRKKSTVEYLLNPDIARMNIPAIKSLAVDINAGVDKVMTINELRQLFDALVKLEPYFKHWTESQNIKYNKYRWKAEEKDAISRGLKQMNKKPQEITEEDIVRLSMFVRTRSPMQCRRFLDYRIKNKTVIIN